MNPIVQWVLRTMMKGQTGVVRALPKKELLDINVNITVERLIKNGIDPSAIKTPDQVDNIIKQIEQPKVIPADSPRGKGITEALFGKKGEVFDMEGKKIKPGSKIMGGKEVKDSNVDAIIADIKAMDPMDSMKEANSVIGRKDKYKNLSPEESKKILQDTEDHIFERDIPVDPEDMAEGGRIGYKDGPKLSDFIDVQASGSKSGKQQIMGAPDGITIDSESINAIVKADIPISQKIDLLADYQYGKGRNKFEDRGKEIFLDEGGFKNRNVGLGFNQDGDGLGGKIMYNLESGDPTLNIRFKKRFAEGGRIGFFKGAQADTKEGKSMSPGTDASGGFRGGGGGGGNNNPPPVVKTPPPKPKPKVKKNISTGSFTPTFNFIKKFMAHDNYTDQLKASQKPNYHQMGGLDFMARFPNTDPDVAKGLASAYQNLFEYGRAIADGPGGITFDDAGKKATEESRLNAIGIDAYANPDSSLYQDYFNQDSLTGAVPFNNQSMAQGGRAGFKSGASKAFLNFLKKFKVKQSGDDVKDFLSKRQFMKDIVGNTEKSRKARELAMLKEAMEDTKGFQFPSGKELRTDIEKKIQPILNKDRKLNSDGGRIGLKAGMTKRAFLKLMGMTGAGIAGLKSGLLGLGGKQATKQVAKELTSVPIGNPEGMPAWFKPLVNKIIKEGDDVTKKFGTVDREIVHTKKIDKFEEVTVYQDLNTGNVRLEYGPHLTDDTGKVIRASNEPTVVQLEYKAPEVLEPNLTTGKGGGKTKEEFYAAESEPEIVNWDGDIEMSGINEVNKVDDLITDTSKLQKYATDNKLTIKELSDSMKKQKYKNKLDSDLGEQVNYIENKSGMNAMDYIDEGTRVGDFDPKGYRNYDTKGINLPEKKASGGIARMLGE